MAKPSGATPICAFRCAECKAPHGYHVWRLIINWRAYWPAGFTNRKLDTESDAFVRASKMFHPATTYVDLSKDPVCAWCREHLSQAAE